MPPATSPGVTHPRARQTSYIDMYYVHFCDFITPAEEIMSCFHDAVRMGYIHYPAVSDFPAWKLAQMQTLAKERGWPQCVRRRAGAERGGGLTRRLADSSLRSIGTAWRIARSSERWCRRARSWAST